jgi:EF hand
MKNFVMIATLAGLLGSAAVPALAQTATQTDTNLVADASGGTGDGGGWGGHGRHGRHGHHGMARDGEGRGGAMIDLNGDGVISEDEAAASSDHMFLRLDANGDGALSEAEFTKPRHAHFWNSWFNSAEIAAVQKVRKDKFAQLDTDKNVSVNKAEFLADAKAKLAAADADKDGKVTPWEFRAAN